MIVPIYKASPNIHWTIRKIFEAFGSAAYKLDPPSTTIIKFVLTSESSNFGKIWNLLINGTGDTNLPIRGFGLATDTREDT